MSAPVLIVEDDRAYGRLVGTALEGLGYATRQASTAAEGFRLALELRPRLIVTDVGLPDATGFDLLRALRGRPELTGTRVLIVTGTHAAAEEESRAAGVSADAYLMKPFRVAELSRVVARLLGG